MNTASRATLGLLFLLATVQTAEAKRFRLFSFGGGGGGESIEQVYDLPDREPFMTDGDYVDVGYLSGSYRQSYVLYHGDRFRSLDDADLAVLKQTLGFDPTAKHREQYAIDHADEIAAAAAEKKHKEDRIAAGLMIERRPGESSEDYAVRKAEFIARHRSGSSRSPFAKDTPATAEVARPDMGASEPPKFGFGISILVVLAIVGTVAYKMSSAAFGRKQAAAEDAPGGEDFNSLSFDERVARRLSELQNGGAPADLAGDRATGGIRPAAPAFGRKTSL